MRLAYQDKNGDGQIAQTEILEENNYYPFGLKHEGYNGTPSESSSNNKYKYQYNGKEFQEELGLNWNDYGARNYDPAIGRWMNMDPLAEKYEANSPYNYVNNNPLVFIDPDGAKIEWGEIDEELKKSLQILINYLRDNSESFREHYDYLDNSENIFLIELVQSEEEYTSDDQFGGATYPGIRYDFELNDDGTIGETTENPVTHVITFYSGNSKIPFNDNTVSTVAEEFVHLQQFDFYKNGTWDWNGSRPSAGNIEYEAKLITGVILSESGNSTNISNSADRFAHSKGQLYQRTSSTTAFPNDIKEWHKISDNFYSKDNVNPEQPPSLFIQSQLE